MKGTEKFHLLANNSRDIDGSLWGNRYLCQINGTIYAGIMMVSSSFEKSLVYTK